MKLSFNLKVKSTFLTKKVLTNKVQVCHIISHHHFFALITFQSDLEQRSRVLISPTHQMHTTTTATTTVSKKYKKNSLKTFSSLILFQRLHTYTLTHIWAQSYVLVLRRAQT